MTRRKDRAPSRPVCSACAGELSAGGFRIEFEKNAQLYVDACSVCGKRLPVHDGWILGAKRKTKK